MVVEQKNSATITHHTIKNSKLLLSDIASFYVIASNPATVPGSVTGVVTVPANIPIITAVQVTALS